MNDPSGLPDWGTPPAPPPPPPRPRTPTWVWLLTGFVAVSVLVLFGIGVALSFSSDPFSSGGQSGGEDGDYYFVDQESVLSAVREPCEDLEDSAADLEPVGPPEQAAEQLGAVSTDMQAIISAIDAAVPDTDSSAWRDDWVVLADSVQQFAEAIADDPEATFTMPMSQGDRVTDRMIIGSYECVVPAGLFTLDAPPQPDLRLVD